MFVFACLFPVLFLSHLVYTYESQILCANVISLFYVATARMLILKRETRKHLKTNFYTFETLITDKCIAQHFVNNINQYHVTKNSQADNEIHPPPPTSSLSLH